MYKAGAGWKPTQDVYPKFDALCQRQDIYAPFEDKDEWELARWLFMNVGQTQTKVFLKLPIVSVDHLSWLLARTTTNTCIDMRPHPAIIPEQPNTVEED